ncbi:MAG: YkgJ family cysteine cluster protein, partial [Bacteroidota bacterium]
MKEDQHIKTDLEVIELFASQKENENDRFKDFLQSQDEAGIDEMVHELNEDVSSEIDCTQCGNCCRTLMINVTDNEASEVSSYLKISKTDFTNTYIEKSTNGIML